MTDDQQGEGYERILVGSDGSDRAAGAVTRAADVARATGASLTILGVGSADKLLPALKAQARAVEGDGLDVEVRVEHGNPPSVLIEVARDEHFDLLVLGNKGMSGFERLLLGSVPNKVSHHLPCSLLIVRTG